VASFFPAGRATPEGGEPRRAVDGLRRDPRERVDGDVYEETRVGPAGDATLATPETQGRLVEVFLRVARQGREEEAEAPLILEMASDEPLTLETAPPATPPPTAAPVVVPEPEPPPIVLEKPAGGREALGRGDDPEDPDHQDAGATDPRRGHPPRHPGPPSKGPSRKSYCIWETRCWDVLAGGRRADDRPRPRERYRDRQRRVSRRHAVIRMQDDKVLIEDLGSANGTFFRARRSTSTNCRTGMRSWS